jgi:site-specific DNA-methyltransferase (adenine-specific)
VEGDFMKFKDYESGRFYNEDCFDTMKEIPDQSIDMILCDLPYGTTACAWDSILPFDKLWAEYERLISGYGAIVLCGAEPFSSSLRSSNFNLFKYDWIWCKSRSLGFTNAKNKPMNKHEIVSVFSKGTVANKSDRRMPYFPQDLIISGKKVSGIKACAADSEEGGHKFARASHKEEYIQEYTNYPTSLLEIPNEGKGFHPTQKPVALFEYLIRTYTNEGALILDNTAGSGTTAIAAINTNRRWVCIEKDETYALKAVERIDAHLLKRTNDELARIQPSVVQSSDENIEGERSSSLQSSGETLGRSKASIL